MKKINKLQTIVTILVVIGVVLFFIKVFTNHEVPTIISGDIQTPTPVPQVIPNPEPDHSPFKE